MLQDTVQAVVDSLPVVVDTVKAVAQDSAATSAVQQLSTQVNAGVALGLGFVVKLVVDALRKVIAKIDQSPALVKTAIATGTAFGATWLSGVVGFPVSTDPSSLESTVSALLVAGVSMGVHGVVKSVGSKKSS